MNADFPLCETGVLEVVLSPPFPGGPGVTEPSPVWWRCCSMSEPPPPAPAPPPPPPPPPPDGPPPPDMLFGVGVLDGQGSPAPNGLPRSVKLSVVVLPGRSTLVATSMPPPQPTVLADKLADDVVAAAVARTPYGARILGASVSRFATPHYCCPDHGYVVGS